MLLPLLLCSCGKDDDTKTNDEITSEPTVEYLCSALIWAYAPEGGIKSDEKYSNFAFQRINNILYCTAAGKYWVFTLAGSTLTLKETSYWGDVVEGGETKILSVYKLTKNDNRKYLLINGKRYVAAAGSGIDI